ncbi:MAG TPA: (2Fe-2S) ferredoxin domain-containing protein [Kofleriaceae bacterium]|nr:(2Fe-2S) ferredoxin domain-containing protein [Kofleriaceae bacterium]
MPERRFRVIVCRGPECGDRRNSRAVHEAFAGQIAAHRLAGRCELDWQSCFGRCSQGPNVLVRELPQVDAPRPRFALADLPPSRGGGPRLATALYNRIDPVKVVEVVARHVIQGAVVGRFIERPELPVSTPPSSPPGEPDV